ncbi:MAG: superoxide dismutase [Chloroflexi bacterium]|nr:superoxide dismutase [Chloroflexota bacterium]MCI0576383.1 superoxide dismutase [Chloroflexota bacterium]MCI0643866.1 superoxide dismutase [Chloroflexota bacterium]MCI0730591.1 superoxide dismutase [Chloroflexota bacterium]
MKKKLIGLFAVTMLLLIAGSVVAGPTFPEIIPLPNGFAPEGVATGHGPELFVGSLATGQIYRADLDSGAGEVVVDSPAGSPAVGLAFDERSGLLFAAGGSSGQAFVYDPGTGATAAMYTLTAPGSFVNDVVVAEEAAYLTDSFRPVFYRLPLGPGGSLPEAGAIEEIPLSGDYVFLPGSFNANGIETAANGKWLIIVHSSRGELYRVDPATGEATLIDLGGDAVPAGDGILLQGQTLYVVQNQLNQIAVVELAPDLASGDVVEIITNPAFRVPTTVAGFGPYLYAVNARFGVPPGPDTEYEVVRVEK